MRPILAGIETEFGLSIEGRGAQEQIDDSGEVVKAFPEFCFVGWDYRQESPRADLRGFRLDRLATDPVDAQFDAGRTRTLDIALRADRVLINGARFYNDHGHPEYATPECRTLNDLVLYDLAGELTALQAARAFEHAEGKRTRVYKNNTDFHGASYGTHESYLVPRRLGFEGLYAALLPLLIARPLLCGAGKVGAESGDPVRYQISQRGDFFTEPANAETLYRRPIFNTRDEPHADPREWIRLHVICGDANRIPSCTRRKAGLVKLAVALAEVGDSPRWTFRDPVRAGKQVSRGLDADFRIELDGANWTTAEQVLESYLAAGEKVLQLPPDHELSLLIGECRTLLEARRNDPERFAYSVDWAAKLAMLRQYQEAEGGEWDQATMQSLDLEYTNLDPDESLYDALVQMGLAEGWPPLEEVLRCTQEPPTGTRAFARGHAVRLFRNEIESLSWSCLTLRGEDELKELYLDPSKHYPQELAQAESVKDFIELLEAP